MRELTLTEHYNLLRKDVLIYQANILCRVKQVSGGTLTHYCPLLTLSLWREICQEKYNLSCSFY